MKKLITLALAAGLSFSAFAGCGNNNNNNNNNNAANNNEGGTNQGNVSNLKGTVTFVTNRTDLIDNGEYDRYAKNFRKQYPNVKIAFEGLTNYEQDIRVRLSTGEAGDVLLIPGNVSPAELPKYFEPLDDIGIFNDAYFADYKAYESKRYGITSGVNVTGVIYNKKAFAKAGITDVPKTIDEFYDACKKLKAAKIIPVYTNYGAQWPMQNWGENGLVPSIAGDPEFLNKMVDQDDPLKEDNPFGKAYTILRTLVKKGYVEPDLSSNNWETSKVDVATGNAGMFFLANWAINQVITAGAAAEDVGFFPMPYDNSGKTTALLNPDWFYAVSSGSKNKEAAKAFVKFMVADSGFDTDQGFIPVLKTKEPTLAQLTEFNSYKPTLMENKPTVTKWNDIANKSQIGFFTGSYIQDIVQAKNLKSQLDVVNKKWKSARSAVK